MNDAPDFEALRRVRNERMRERIEKIAREMGWDGEEPLQTSFNPDACYCDCARHGPCEHTWDGEPYCDDGMYSVTCSRCGTTAVSHSMRIGL